ncbi:MAG TPA: substrate-binding domain-containing protein [Burkholderiaceae bacterium]|nr:substrate-binding domain-containing protein [Burkholderiaceae bacterium]
MSISLALLLGPAGSAAAQDLRLATTTSTENSGLLKVILPKFEAKSHLTVRVIAVGTGKALKLGEDGDADVLLVHAPAAELAFMAAGHGVNRRKVMHNDFVVVGPASDPAGVRGGTDVIAAFRRIAEKKAKFISRGDDSGTDKMEKGYWPLADVSPSGQSWYVSAGQGMGEVLTMAAELQAYTLTDRSTFAAYRARSGLQIDVQGDARMFNPYHVMAVNPAKYPDINFRGAATFSDWITSPEGQQAIADFQIEGKQVFFPDAQEPDRPGR